MVPFQWRKRNEVASTMPFQQTKDNKVPSTVPFQWRKHNKEPSTVPFQWRKPDKVPSLDYKYLMTRWCPLYIFSCPCPSNILNPPLHLQAVVGVGCCRAAASVRDKDESKINFISDISANKTPRQAFICIFSTVVVCLSYSGIRAVTFFSHSAFPSLSPAS